jgi:hypothetical protein
VSSIPHLSQALQTVFTTVATSAARTTGFIRRQRQLTGAGFVQALVFGFLAHPNATLEQLTASAANVGVRISPQGLEQRFTETAAACLQHVLEAAVQHLLAAKPVAIPILQRFSGVYLLDSTTITLPDALASVWPGCGGSTPGTAAALKLQVLWNLTTGTLAHLGLHAGRASDQRAPVQAVALPSGALRIADLGYFALDQIAWLRSQGCYVLSRWYPQTRLFDLSGCPLQLLDLLQEAHPTLDQAVLLGAKQRIPVRLLALRVPQEVADQRRRRIREEARAKGRTVSPHVLVLAAWTICITTVPQEQLSVTEALVLLRVRWQIELLFKLWKSYGQVDTSRSAQPWRILCEVYAKLLGMLVLHWVVLVSCWHDAQRSLPKVARLMQGHALALAAVVRKARPQITASLRRIIACIQGGCQINPRHKRPNTYQLLLALGDGVLT